MESIPFCVSIAGTETGFRSRVIFSRQGHWACVTCCSCGVRSCPRDHRPHSTEVLDVTAIDLLRTAAAIRDGEVFELSDVDDHEPFFLGAVATAFDPDPEWQPEKLLAKADAGAQFVQLQLCMNIDMLRNYVSRLVEARLTWRFQVLATIAVLPSAEAARELRHYQPDAVIPSSIVHRLEQAKDPEAEGIAIAADTLRAISDIPGISGANLVTPGSPESIAASIEESSYPRRVVDAGYARSSTADRDQNRGRGPGSADWRGGSLPDRR